MNDASESTELVTVESAPLIETRRAGGTGVPALVAAGGGGPARRFLEFFAVTIDNPNTRAAYFHACGRFFVWCDRREDIVELVDIEPMHVAAYIRGLGKGFEKPTVKQHLAAIRMLFDWLVTGQIVATNPAHAVRGPYKKRGPPATGKGQQIVVRVHSPLLPAIDSYIAAS